MYKPINSSNLTNKNIKIVDPKVLRFEKFRKDNIHSGNLARLKTMEIFAFRTSEK